MTALYQVVVIHKDMEESRSEVVSSVREAVTGILHNADLLTFPRHIEDVDDRSQVAVIYLGSRAGVTDRGIHGQIETAMRRQFPILPVVHGSGSGQVEAKLPLVISALHAEDWASEESKITRHLLTMLGLAERERRLFVSYVQRDSTEMALQITDSLNRSQFDVFLDRLSLLPGEDYASRIARDLNDKAFVLLLESANISQSKWVRREVMYALAHNIEVLSVTRPGLDQTQLMPSVDENLRVRLRCCDMANGRLTDAGLRSVLTRIEQAHAAALRRRREQTLGSITKRLEHHGYRWHQVGDWSVVAIGSQGRASVLMATPREACPADLRALHCTQQRTRSANNQYSDASATLVHRGIAMTGDDKALLEWIAEPRQLGMETLDDFVGGIGAVP